MQENKNINDTCNKNGAPVFEKMGPLFSNENIKYSPFNKREIKKNKYENKNIKHPYNLRKQGSYNTPLLQCILGDKVTKFKGLVADVLTCQTFAPQSASHIYDASGKKQSIDKLINGPDALTEWLPALSNEWGRLARENDNGVAHTDTIQFISFISQDFDLFICILLLANPAIVELSVLIVVCGCG